MGIHRMPRKPSIMTRTVAAGGAACCFGLLADVTSSTADASSTTLVVNGNTIQINILSGNIINPQLSLGGLNSSNNSTIGNISTLNGNGNTTTVTSTGTGSGTTGTTVSNGNTTQIDFLSGNIINPQLSLGGLNSSNNSTIGNISAGNGNGNTTAVTSTAAPSGTTPLGRSSLPGVTVANGNSKQTGILSGNIINPQLSFAPGSGGSGNPLGTPFSRAASVNGTPSKPSVSFTGQRGQAAGGHAAGSPHF